MFNGDGLHDGINPKGYRELYYEYFCSARGNTEGRTRMAARPPNGLEICGAPLWGSRPASRNLVSHS